MTDDAHLSQIMSTVAAKMLADFKGSSPIRHRGGKGDVREEDLRSNFLDAYLPGTVKGVGQGEAWTADGAQSGECDIMILDPATPPLWDRESHRVVPIECLHGIVEVKSNLTASELKKTWNLIRQAKLLRKSAFRPNIGPERYRMQYGRKWTYMPVSGFIFAYESAEFDTLCRTLGELAGGEPETHLWIDAIFVLNRGYIVWMNPKTRMIEPAPNPKDSIAPIDAEPGQVLMAFIGILYQHFADAWMPGTLDILKYLRGSLGTPNALWNLESTDTVTYDGGSP